MKNRSITWIVLVLTCFLFLESCFDKSKYEPKPYLRPLEIVKLSETSFLHISYLRGNNGGYIPCNGYVRVSEGEAVVFDTPIDNATAQQLINYIKKELKVEIVAVVLSHYHEDAAGGLDAFQNAKIPSYASIWTANELESFEITHTFDDIENFSVGKLNVESRYFGPAHTRADVVSYIAEDSLLIGGCSIKPLKGSKGNLSDAFPEEWSQTLKKVQAAYPDMRRVIPGHGAIGDQSLVDYTIQLFQKDTVLPSI